MSNRPYEKCTNIFIYFIPFYFLEIDTYNKNEEQTKKKVCNFLNSETVFNSSGYPRIIDILMTVSCSSLFFSYRPGNNDAGQLGLFKKKGATAYLDLPQMTSLGVFPWLRLQTRRFRDNEL